MADGRPTRIPLTNFLQASAQVFPCQRVILVDDPPSSDHGADGLCGSAGGEAPRGGLGGYRRGVFRYFRCGTDLAEARSVLRGGRGTAGQGAAHLIDEALTPQWGVGGATRRGEGASPPLLFCPSGHRGELVLWLECRCPTEVGHRICAPRVPVLRVSDLRRTRTVGYRAARRVCPSSGVRLRPPVSDFSRTPAVDER